MTETWERYTDDDGMHGVKMDESHSVGRDLEGWCPDCERIMMLIESAPDLLAALEDIASGSCCESGGNFDDPCCDVMTARAAIAKENRMKSVIEVVVVVIGIAGAVIGAVVIGPLVSAAAGYFTGWVLAEVFTFAGRWVVSGANAVGAEVSIGQLPEIGAGLAFVGAFFKAQQTNKVEK